MQQPIQPSCAASDPPARRRLAPQVRVAQILDAALVEFSERGFAATTMDDIGRRCGLSKGGLYAHFASKDVIFEALLHRSLAPPEWQEPPVPPVEAGTRAFAQWLVGRLYAGLLERPAVVATLRLLAAERGRVKDLVELWEHNVVRPNMALLADMLRVHAAQLGLPPSVIVREPWLVMAPVMHALLAQMILGHEPAMGLDCLRSSHVELLCELLDPRERRRCACSSGEVIEGGVALGQGAALRVHEAQARFGADAADARHGRGRRGGRAGHGLAPRGRGGEGEFVVVASGQRALA